MPSEHFWRVVKMSKIDWVSVDWSKNNRELAMQLGKAYNTVAKKRYQLGESGRAKSRAKRSDNGLKNPNNAAGGRVSQPLATEAAKASPISGKFETNIHAKKWKVITPDNKIFIVRNLYQFVRDNGGLFLPKDVIFKRQGGKRGTGGEYCNATQGLRQAASSGRSWKGWTCMKIKDK